MRIAIISRRNIAGEARLTPLRFDNHLFVLPLSGRRKRRGGCSGSSLRFHQRLRYPAPDIPLFGIEAYTNTNNLFPLLLIRSCVPLFLDLR